MSRAVEQIKERLPIADLISSYIKLDRAGANLKGKCPFHNEKTPSFFVSPERNSYYCFGCGAKGDVFTFLQEFEKVDFKEALSILADRTGVVLEKFSGTEDTKEQDEKEKLRKIMEEAASYFEGVLKEDTVSMEYLKKRALEEATITEWRIGSTKKGWDNLYFHLKDKGYSDTDMEKAGLAKQGNRGLYDRFRSRIIFPIFDPAGHVIAFTGRLKEWEETTSEAKYLNSPDTPLFDKSRTLYGFHKAKKSISKWKFFLLVEGQMDLLMAHQAGFSNAIATSGTALTRFQLDALIRFSKNLMIAYDGDNAGVEAARRAWTLALSLGMDVKIARLPEGKDPADIIASDLDSFKESLRKGSHIVEFYLNVLMGRAIEKRALGKAVEQEILPYVKAIDSAIDRQHFLSMISAKTGIKEEALAESLKKAPTAVSNVLPSISEGDTIPAHNIFSKRRLIAGIYLLLKEENKAREYLENADEIKEELIFAAEEWTQRSGQVPESALPDLLASLEKEELREKLEEAMRKWSEASEKGDKEAAKKLLKESDEIREKLAKFQ